MDFFTADPHYYHTRIIDYCNRPFSSVEEMNDVLIKKYNSKVSKHDRCFILGDFSFFKNKEKLEKLIASLNGYKILVKGNHDTDISNSKWQRLGFDEVYPYPIIYNGFYILSHDIVFMNSSMPYVNIHGHYHQNVMKENYYYSVSVENTDYAPVSFKEIEELKRRN